MFLQRSGDLFPWPENVPRADDAVEQQGTTVAAVGAGTEQESVAGGQVLSLINYFLSCRMTKINDSVLFLELTRFISVILFDSFFYQHLVES